MSAGPRRLRFGASTLVLLACATVSCVLAGALGSRLGARWDLTRTRQFTLSERTERALERLAEETTVVISADMSAIARDDRARVADLLAEMSGVNPKVRSAWIDTASPAAGAEVGALVGRLASPHAALLDQQAEAIARSAADAVTLAAGLRGLSDQLKSLGVMLGAREPALLAGMKSSPEEQAGLVRTLASSLDEAGSSLARAGAASIAGIAMPALDEARRSGEEPLTRTARASEAIAQFADAVHARASTAEAREALRVLARESERLRDLASVSWDRIDALDPCEALRIARVLERTQCALVTSSNGSALLDFSTLFPPAAGAGGGVYAGESLLATALASLNDDASPIVIFVHAQGARLLDDDGEPTPAANAAFAGLFQRMRLSRVTPLEWSVSTMPLRPDPTTIDPGGVRPALWVVLGAPPRTSADLTDAGAAADRVDRTRRLGDALRTLIEAGEHVLISIEPSDAPSLGSVDPIAQAATLLGVGVGSDKVILRRESSPQGDLVWSHVETAEAEKSHAIGAAVHGLRMVLPWAIPLRAGEAAEGWTMSPLLRVASAGDLWGESRWMTLRDLAGRGIVRPLMPMLLADPPKLEPPRDDAYARGDVLVVAAALERGRRASETTPHGMRPSSPQRVVIVGSSEWLHDGYTQASEPVGGRRAVLFPGNHELFEAAITWLAGRDEAIAPGPQAMDLPRIRAIDPGVLQAVRLLLVLGLPSLVLIVGAVHRLLRG